MPCVCQWVDFQWLSCCQPVYLQLLLRWQSCPWIVLTGQISVPGYGMLMWQKSFIPCMRPNVCLWIVLKCKNILNHQNFINIFLSAKISSSIITLIEWIISQSVCMCECPKPGSCILRTVYWQVRTWYYTSTVIYSCGKIFVIYLALILSSIDPYLVRHLCEARHVSPICIDLWSPVL